MVRRKRRCARSQSDGRLTVRSRVRDRMFIKCGEYPQHTNSDVGIAGSLDQSVHRVHSYVVVGRGLLTAWRVRLADDLLKESGLLGGGEVRLGIDLLFEHAEISTSVRRLDPIVVGRSCHLLDRRGQVAVHGVEGSFDLSSRETVANICIVGDGGRKSTLSWGGEVLAIVGVQVGLRI